MGPIDMRTRWNSQSLSESFIEFFMALWERAVSRGLQGRIVQGRVVLGNELSGDELLQDELSGDELSSNLSRESQDAGPPADLDNYGDFDLVTSIQSLAFVFVQKKIWPYRIIFIII
jgi:hypothetical protein